MLCFSGLKPAITLTEQVKITKNTAANISCQVYGQAGTEYQWETGNEKINNNSYYHVAIGEQKNTDLNISHHANLLISSNISTFFVGNNDSNCTVVERKKSVICYLSFTCVAYYVPKEKMEKRVTISFAENGTMNFF